MWFYVLSEERSCSSFAFKNKSERFPIDWRYAVASLGFYLEKFSTRIGYIWIFGKQDFWGNEELIGKVAGRWARENDAEDKRWWT